MTRHAPGRDEFKTEREGRRLKIINEAQVIRRENAARWIRGCRRYEWCLFGPLDVRYSHSEYLFTLQYTFAGGLRVRVGCRYYTLEQAWKHWGPRAKHHYKRGAKQAVLIIRLMLLQAEAYGLPGVEDTRFEASRFK